MTEYELNDLILTQQALIANSITLYLSVLSGYLAAAFLVGKRLTASQAALISTIFAVAATIMIAIAVVRVVEINRFSSELGSIGSGLSARPPSFVSYLMLSIAILGIVAALKFMWDVRHAEET